MGRKKNRRSTFLFRLRSAWMVLCGKYSPPMPGADQPNIVRVAYKAVPVRAEWWCPADREAWARENLAREIALSASPFVQINVRYDEDRTHVHVCGELLVYNKEV